MSDLISRQAVLDELEKWDWQDLYLPIHFKQILDDIPSADIMECAREIKEYCKNEYKKNGYKCDECLFMSTDPMYICSLSHTTPCFWNLPEGKKGGAE